MRKRSLRRVEPPPGNTRVQLSWGSLQDGTLKTLEEDDVAKAGKRKYFGPLLAVELLMLSGELGDSLFPSGKALACGFH